MGQGGLHHVLACGRPSRLLQSHPPSVSRKSAFLSSLNHRHFCLVPPLWQGYRHRSQDRTFSTAGGDPFVGVKSV